MLIAWLQYQVFNRDGDKEAKLTDCSLTIRQSQEQGHPPQKDVFLITPALLHNGDTLL